MKENRIYLSRDNVGEFFAANLVSSILGLLVPFHIHNYIL